MLSIGGRLGLVQIFCSVDPLAWCNVPFFNSVSSLRPQVSDLRLGAALRGRFFRLQA
jgi:hypothetical protein